MGGRCDARSPFSLPADTVGGVEAEGWLGGWVPLSPIVDVGGETSAYRLLSPPVGGEGGGEGREVPV